MSDFTIRQYKSEDRTQCRELWRELTEWHRQIYNDATIGGDSPEDDFDKHLAKVGLENLWVATDESKLVGLVGLIVGKNEAEVEPLIVRHSHRRRGIGTQLLETVITEARKLPIRYLNIRPVARNIVGLHFFHGQGFDNIGHIQLFMDLSQRSWKTGIVLHNRQFNY